MAHTNAIDPAKLATRIQHKERAAVAVALNLIDNVLPAARQQATQLLSALSDAKSHSEGHVIGITGPPGAGKSSLVAALIRQWRRAGQTVAVLAVDPSSRPELGGGALLGDRIRIKNTVADDGLFIRSLASRNELGGVTSGVWPMSWILLSCFDRVVVETVGVGQTEIDIAEVSDTVCYVAQPASGDTIQYLKSGIMEIPDVFAVNKSDLGPAAHKTAAEITRAAEKPDHRAGWSYPVCLVSATQNEGIEQLAEAIAEHRSFLQRSGILGQQRACHQRNWIYRQLKAEFGSFGVQIAGGPEAIEQRLARQSFNPFAQYESIRRSIASQFIPQPET
ncbi:MAG: P-loop NTPase fold protein [Georgfuchsia sp.]